jgi:penicillin-binding protein 1A
MRFAKILATLVGLLFALVLVAAVGVGAVIISFSSDLPQMIKVEDYKPLLVTEVYARGGEKIGEFMNEKRTLVPYDKMPKQLIQAFLAAEDDTFFEHGGINYVAILRAAFVNVTAGGKRQGASTITQQVARSLLLSSEKTYTRKIKEILLSYKMEENLSKEEILFLYLNQIYFGEGAYGVAAAAETYFRKTVDQLTLPEVTILAGLPQAPSNYSPTRFPQRAKARQKYVLERMSKVGFITPEEAQKAANEPVTVYLAREYKQVAPYFVEAIRILLVSKLGEKAVLDEGLRVHTSIDFRAQQEATNQVQAGLRDLDKRQGYRGPIKTLEGEKAIEDFLLATRKKLRSDRAPIRVIKPDGNVEPDTPLTVFRKTDAQGKIVSNIPDYASKGQTVDAVVTKVDDTLGLTYVRFAEGMGLMDVADMAWARKPDPSVNYDYAPRVSRPSSVLKAGDVILVRVTGEKFASQRLEREIADRKKKAPGKPVTDVPNPEEYAQVALEQQPQVEGALISFDQRSGDVLAMVGGYEWVHKVNEFNRAVQAKRQTGSSFKTIVYAAALDKGYTPATPIQDAPLVYDLGKEEGQDDPKMWKPHNHGQKFEGDILFRRALIRSLNIPTVKILENIGVSWAMDYAKRLGISSPLNADLSLGLGSSSVSLYEMTKVFAHFGRLGQRLRPIVIHKVTDKDGNILLENVSLDARFDKELAEIDEQFERRRKQYLESGAAGQNAQADSETAPMKPKDPQIFFNDPDQLISPQTAYVMTSILAGSINEEGGTAGRARALGRPAAGKTGSTNGYFDAWFVGYTSQIATGVWIGFDQEKTLGPGEVGGRAALPIWVEYMKAAHQDLPVQDFPVPNGIVFANIDNQTGRLASASSNSVVRQAFAQGTEPSAQATASPTRDEEAEFLKKDLSE